MLTFLAGIGGGFLLAVAIWAAANTHVVQRAFPGVGALPWIKDHGYRVFSILLDGPSQSRVGLAEESRLLAERIRATLSEPPRPWYAGPRVLSDERQRLLRCLIRHLRESQTLLGRASEAGAIATYLVPTSETPFPVPVDELPAFLDEVARRLETGLRLRKISRALGHEIPASMRFVYLA